MQAMTGCIGVVSGGTRGIGLALSRRLCKLGYTVIALYHRDHRTAQEAVAGHEPQLEAVQLDVSRPDEVRRVCERLLERGQDVLCVHNFLHPANVHQLLGKALEATNGGRLVPIPPRFPDRQDALGQQALSSVLARSCST